MWLNKTSIKNNETLKKALEEIEKIQTKSVIEPNVIKIPMMSYIFSTTIEKNFKLLNGAIVCKITLGTNSKPFVFVPINDT